MEISEEGPDFGLVSTRMVSVLKPVTNGAFAFVGTEDQPAFASGIGFVRQPRLFVELSIHPIPCGEYRQSQGENHSKEKRENDPPHMSFSVGEHGFRSGLESCCAIAGQRLSGHVLSRCSWHASGYGGGSSYLLRRTVIVRS